MHLDRTTTGHIRAEASFTASLSSSELSSPSSQILQPNNLRVCDVITLDRWWAGRRLTHHEVGSCKQTAGITPLNVFIQVWMILNSMIVPKVDLTADLSGRPKQLEAPGFTGREQSMSLPPHCHGEIKTQRRQILNKYVLNDGLHMQLQFQRRLAYLFSNS